MRHTDIGADAGAPTHGRTDDDGHVRSFTVDGRTVLFDVDDAERWIESDAAVDPTRIA